MTATTSILRVSPAAAKARRRNWRVALSLMAPFLAVYLIFLIYPTIRVITLSFTDADIAGVGKFIGFKNYARLLHDPLFWASLWHTIYFMILCVVPNAAAGLLFALLLVRLRRARGLVQALFFMPYILPVSVVTVIWIWMFDSSYGVVNFLLHTKIQWIQDAAWAMPTVAFVTIWWTVGFNMLLFIAGLESIPKEYYEAAALDGASGGFKVFRHITWPLLWPVTSLVLILQILAQWQIFNQVYLLTNGGPANKTLVILQYMYVQGFQNGRGGYAATISVALFVLILVTSIFQVRFLRVKEDR
ncbi:MAG: sugar ABC transporter permease [Treponema sp.]|nr:sugar ABC transporter permease [Treponema sp.]